MRITERVQDVLELAAEEAQELGHTRISTETLLLGILRANESIAMQVLLNHRVTVESVREQIRKIVKAQ